MGGPQVTVDSVIPGLAALGAVRWESALDRVSISVIKHYDHR